MDYSPAHKVKIKAFYMDVHELTNAEYYKSDYYKDYPSENPKVPETGKFKVHRGGG